MIDGVIERAVSSY